MSIKKYTSGSWVTVPYRKYKTATDTITTLPKQIIGDGQSATANIIGNMVQTGTPSPSSIIIPDECGDLVTSGEHSGQYQIPILCGNTTTNVYLGEVQSTRQIKKLVVDGTEDWWEAPYAPIPSLKRYGITLSSTAIIGSTDVLCTHYVATTVSNDSIQIGSNMRSLYISDNENGTTLSDWKTYLQQQYANGTPVCVWYVLATPQTTTLNEPIRKIGNYADSVSVTGIPTTGTAESFDIDTTLKPSEVSLTYHGWHSQEPNKYEETGQLYDKTTDVNGYRLNPSGNLIAENGYSTSLAIPVNTKFLTRNHEFSTMEPICEYKANNTFIARTVSGSTIELNDETSYVRMTVNNTWDDVTLKGSQWT